jgi:hypothetical protein
MEPILIAVVIVLIVFVLGLLVWLIGICYESFHRGDW